MKCPVCDKDMTLERVPYFTDGINLGEYEAEVCHEDNETFFTEKAARLIELAEKEAGVWGSEIPVHSGKEGSAGKVKS